MNEQFLKRLKSFGWRLGMMAIALLVTFLLDNLSLLELPASASVIVGLLLGELSKYLNSRNN